MRHLYNFALLALTLCVIGRYRKHQYNFVQLRGKSRCVLPGWYLSCLQYRSYSNRYQNRWRGLVCDQCNWQLFRVRICTKIYGPGRQSRRCWWSSNFRHAFHCRPSFARMYPSGGQYGRLDSWCCWHLEQPLPGWRSCRVNGRNKLLGPNQSMQGGPHASSSDFNLLRLHWGHVGMDCRSWSG